MSAFLKGGTLKSPSPGLENVDVVNENTNEITEQELEQQEVQNLLTTPEPIHDVQLQLVGYKQEKDDEGKKRSLNNCPNTPKRIKSIYDEKTIDMFHIGKKDIEGENMLMKFLEKSAGNFSWPKRDKKAKVNIKFIFHGSVQLYGNNPFTMPIDQIIIAYKCYKKNRLGIWK
ncbi:hypothetical protein AVEN_271229-1 [Araneus ventricosus]|uniref:Uncharacterized protein n=1 Tax=Araneus ventricosus TaxID=182803 RepID=A0A4Y2RBX1_ARAVE|nr:hypothetical protein AVEN_271229-1 [Araneus ventricosus]